MSSCQESNVIISINFTSIMGFFMINEIDPDNYTSYSIYTLNNTLVVEDFIDHNSKIHCLEAIDYKFILEQMDLSLIGVDETHSDSYSYLPISISVKRYAEEYVVFKSPIVDFAILRFTLYVLPWEASTQQWSYISSASEIPQFSLPTQNVESWKIISSFPEISSNSNNLYFRSSFVVSSLSFISGYELRIMSISPISVYMNGIEVYKNVSASRCSGLNLSLQAWSTITGSVTHMNIGANLISIWVKPVLKAYSENSKQFFNCNLRLFSSSEFGSRNTNIISDRSSETLFDGNMNNLWTASVLEENSYTINWSYAVDSAEMINRLCIVQGDSVENPLAGEIVFSAVVDGVAMPLRSIQYAVTADDDNTPCWDCTNLRSFHSYRILVRPLHGQTSVAATEIMLKLEAMPPPDVPSFTYPASSLRAVAGGIPHCMLAQLETTALLGFFFFDSDIQLIPAVTLSSSTGEVCVSGNDIAGSTVTIGCRSDQGITRQTVSLLVEFESCSASDGTSVVHGSSIAVAICDYSYTGWKYRTCTNGTLSDISSNNCTLLAPMALIYSVNESYYTQDYIYILPSVTNIVTTFSVLPPLPIGLRLIPDTGLLEGTPLIAVTASRHVVKAINLAGFTTFNLSLTVLYRPCVGDGVFGAAESGSRSEADGLCHYGYGGTVFRLCFNGTFGEVQFDDCVLLPPSNLTYEVDVKDQYFVFDAVFFIPSIDGLVSIYEVVPPLPPWLYLNATSGVVNGILKEKEEIMFSVIAKNEKGESSFVFLFNPTYHNCNATEFVEAAAFNTTVDVDCHYWNAIGSRQYRCGSGDGVTEWQVVRDRCYDMFWVLSIGGITVTIVVITIVTVIASISIAVKKQKKVCVIINKKFYVYNCLL